MATKGKLKDMLRILKKDGWKQVAQVGSHRQFKHPVKGGRVTVSGKMNDDVNPKRWDSMMKQAGLK
jgi:predicted RNA binding protein YcfA (HicA-like mRNA interferase family)